MSKILLQQFGLYEQQNRNQNTKTALYLQKTITNANENIWKKSFLTCVKNFLTDNLIFTNNKIEESTTKYNKIQNKKNTNNKHEQDKYEKTDFCLKLHNRNLVFKNNKIQPRINEINEI